MTGPAEGPNPDRWLSVRRLPGADETFRYPPNSSRLTAFSPSFSPDGKRIAALTYDRVSRLDMALRVWDLENGREFQKPLPNNLLPRDVRFSPDGTQIAVRVGDEMADEVFLHDAADGEKRLTLTLPTLASRLASAIAPVVFDAGANQDRLTAGAPGLSARRRSEAVAQCRPVAADDPRARQHGA